MKKILLVEDNEAIMDLNAKYLSMKGYSKTSLWITYLQACFIIWKKCRNKIIYSVKQIYLTRMYLKKPLA